MIIRTENLSKRFIRQRGLVELLRHPLAHARRVTALAGASIEIRQGEVFGLLGPNGAGKTTLLKILSCLILPDAGRAEVNGHDTAREEIAVKRSIGYVTSDERSFYWRLTGSQNLFFFARLMQVPPAEMNKRVQELMVRMELAPKADDLFSTYSSGMKQRLAIARALLHDPPILFLDEPTRSLDPVTARHIRQFIREKLADQAGKTILLATHNLHEAAGLCDRMAIMAGSQVYRTGRLDQFRTLLSAGRRYRLVTDRAVDLAGTAHVIEDGAAPPPPPGSAQGISTLIEPLEDGKGDITGVVRRLASAGVRVLELSREDVSLEDLFQDLFERAALEAGRSGEMAS